MPLIKSKSAPCLLSTSQKNATKNPKHWRDVTTKTSTLFLVIPVFALYFWNHERFFRSYLLFIVSSMFSIMGISYHWMLPIKIRMLDILMCIIIASIGMLFGDMSARIFVVMASTVWAMSHIKSPYRGELHGASHINVIIGCYFLFSHVSCLTSDERIEMSQI